MNLKSLSGRTQLEPHDCRHLVVTNYEMLRECSFMLIPVGKPPLGEIVIIGASPYSITFEAVEVDTIITHDGHASKCIISSELCVGSRTVITNLFGEAWHVSSNIPLLFE